MLEVDVFRDVCYHGVEDRLLFRRERVDRHREDLVCRQNVHDNLVRNLDDIVWLSPMVFARSF